MAALDFPSSPTNGQTYTANGKTWTYDSTTTSWIYTPSTLSVPGGGTGLTSLTSGYIPFGAGTSALGSSSNLTWDDTNSYLRVNGNIGVNSAASATADLNFSGYFSTNSTSATGINASQAVPSSVTGTATAFSTFLSTQQASFTLGTMVHYNAYQATIRAGSAVTNQIAYYISGSVQGATNNYGFRGEIPANGTNNWNLYNVGSAPNYMAGSLGIGSTAITNVSLNIAKTITGNATSYQILSNGTVQSDVTTAANYFSSGVSTAAATFTLGSLTHYNAVQNAFGAGSLVSNQYGFKVDATLVSANGNYGFAGAIPIGVTRTITNVARTANVVTITTSVAHGYTVNQPVEVIATTNTAINGSGFPVASVPTSTTFTYTFAGTDIASVADTGTVQVIGRYNCYMYGSAPNYFSGSVGIGGVPNTTYKLDVTGTARISGALTLLTALGVASGGTGVATLTGLAKGNGASAFTAAVDGTDYLSPTTGGGVMSAFWGDGSDGNVTVSTSVTLTKDMYYNNLTISAGAAINTNGYRIFVAGTLDISAAPAGSFTSNGGAGGAGGNGGASVAGTAGTSGAWGGINYLIGPAAAIAAKAGGLNSTPTAPFNGNSSYQMASPLSLAGASGGGNAGLANNGATAYTGQQALLSNGMFVWAGLPDTSQMSNITVTGGCVGGGGGASNIATSGGGGGGGAGGGAGQLVIVAKTIARGTNTTAGIIQAKGGAGGNGGNGHTVASAGGGGGGQGGHGGYVNIIYNALTGSTITNAIDVSGGAGGKGGNGTTYYGGQGASSGCGGVVSITKYPTMVTTFSNYTTGVAGSAPTTITGGNGAAANTRQVSL